MSFDEKIAVLIQRIPKLAEYLQTEEATKNALVLPFISALGYDVFNPLEVVPEFVADVGTKKGEKVDYAIMRDGEVVFLIECKKAGVELCNADVSQLYRYFSVTKARIGILTSGIQYRFFSDLDAPNRMDQKPFLELDLTDPRPASLAEVNKLAKEGFDLELMLSAASELKYTSEIKKVIAAQLEEPEEDFVRFFFSRVNPGDRFTAGVKETFKPLIARAFSQYISEKVSNRLRNALQSEAQVNQSKSQDQASTASEETEEYSDGLVTTEEELEGFRIIRAIVCKIVPPSRIVHRDTKSYMGILLDDNNRKPICRLHFNSKQIYLGVFDADKNETRIPIQELSEIYNHADQLIAAVQRYDAES